MRHAVCKSVEFISSDSTQREGWRLTGEPEDDVGVLDVPLALHPERQRVLRALPPVTCGPHLLVSAQQSLRGIKHARLRHVFAGRIELVGTVGRDPDGARRKRRTARDDRVRLEMQGRCRAKCLDLEAAPFSRSASSSVMLALRSQDKRVWAARTLD